jgi:DNA-binding NtrC family response regulator
MGILILEDDVNILELIQEKIKSVYPAIKIFKATDPISALSIYEQNKLKINYIVCDYLLPIQNGKDFIDIVKTYSPSIKVCVFTGDGALLKKDIKKADELFYKHDGIDQLMNFIKF